MLIKVISMKITRKLVAAVEPPYNTPCKIVESNIFKE